MKCWYVHDVDLFRMRIMCSSILNTEEHYEFKYMNEINSLCLPNFCFLAELSKELVIVSLTCSMPGLLKTALFIDDDKYKVIFGLSIMKHILLEKSSHGKWLEYVSEFRPERMILYLEALSKLMSDDIDGMLPQTVAIYKEDFARHARRNSSARKNFRGNKSGKWNMLFMLASSRSNTTKVDIANKRSLNGFAEIMMKKRDNVLDYLSNDLLVLNYVSRMSKEYQLQAVSTKVIQLIVDKQTGRPFVACLTVLDTIFHVILFVVSQFQATIYTTTDYQFGDQWFYFAIFCFITIILIYYFIVREILQLMSQRSWVDFKQEVLFDVWNHIDLAAIVLLVSSKQ